MSKFSRHLATTSVLLRERRNRYILRRRYFLIIYLFLLTAHQMTLIGVICLKQSKQFQKNLLLFVALLFISHWRQDWWALMCYWFDQCGREHVVCLWICFHYLLWALPAEGTDCWKATLTLIIRCHVNIFIIHRIRVWHILKRTEVFQRSNTSRNVVVLIKDCST